MKIGRFSKQHILIILEGVAMVGLISKLFYDSIVAFIMLLPLVYFYYKYKVKELDKKMRLEMEREFKELILAVSANLSAGYSVENAFRESYNDIVLIYGKDSVMAKEIYYMMQLLSNNYQMEDILIDLGRRSQVEDIQEFASVFQIAKRRGGDIRAAIANTASVLSDKIEVRREIRTVMSEKEFEQKIMRYIPFVIIGYISITSRGFFDRLYHSLTGILVMTGCLAIYIVAWVISEKILEIEI